MHAYSSPSEILWRRRLSGFEERGLGYDLFPGAAAWLRCWLSCERLQLQGSTEVVVTPCSRIRAVQAGICRDAMVS